MVEFLVIVLVIIAIIFWVRVIMKIVKNTRRTKEEKLHDAIRKGKTWLVKLLLKKKPIDINKFDKNGVTPLTVAKVYDRKKIIRLLEERGAK